MLHITHPHVFKNVANKGFMALFRCNVWRLIAMLLTFTAVFLNPQLSLADDASSTAGTAAGAGSYNTQIVGGRVVATPKNNISSSGADDAGMSDYTSQSSVAQSGANSGGTKSVSRKVQRVDGGFNCPQDGRVIVKDTGYGVKVQCIIPNKDGGETVEKTETMSEKQYLERKKRVPVPVRKKTKPYDPNNVTVVNNYYPTPVKKAPPVQPMNDPEPIITCPECKECDTNMTPPPPAIYPCATKSDLLARNDRHGFAGFYVGTGYSANFLSFNSSFDSGSGGYGGITTTSHNDYQSYLGGIPVFIGGNLVFKHNFLFGLEIDGYLMGNTQFPAQSGTWPYAQLNSYRELTTFFGRAGYIFFDRLLLYVGFGGTVGTLSYAVPSSTAGVYNNTSTVMIDPRVSVGVDFALTNLIFVRLEYALTIDVGYQDMVQNYSSMTNQDTFNFSGLMNSLNVKIMVGL